MNRNIMFFVAVLFILAVLYLGFKTREGYNPYEYRSGIVTKNSGKFIQPQLTGWHYLDQYLGKDYYLQNPWVYPTPNSYITEWFRGRREKSVKPILTPY